MRHINKLQSNAISIGSGRYSDEENEFPAAKRVRENTIISDYEEMWNPSLHDDRGPIILTPPSLVSEILQFDFIMSLELKTEF